MYKSILIQKITMCPRDYHHNGFMATPALGTQEVRLHIVWTALWSHQSAQTVNSEQCIVQNVNVQRGGSSPTVYLFILDWALLSETFQHLLPYNCLLDAQNMLLIVKHYI